MSLAVSHLAEHVLRFELLQQAQTVFAFLSWFSLYKSHLIKKGGSVYGRHRQTGSSFPRDQISGFLSTYQSETNE